MKYCYACGKVTSGEPLYCNFCGKSYNTKLCPHKHPNPRSAQACSQCGSRDLSMPQPRTPWWAPILQVVLSVIPGFLLVIASVSVLLALALEVKSNPQILMKLTIPVALVGVLWWMWCQIPRWFREAIYRLLKRRHEGDDRRRP